MKSQKEAVMHTPIINHALKSVGHYASFRAMILLLHSITDEQQYTKLLCNESMSLQNDQWEAIANRHLASSVKRTETKEDKGNTIMLVM